MKKILLFIIVCILFSSKISAQTNIFIRPTFHSLTSVMPANLTNGSNYTSKPTFDFGGDLGVYLDFEKNKWGITTGFINSSIATPYTFNYPNSNGSTFASTLHHNVYHIPLLVKYKTKNIYLNFLNFAKFMEINIFGGPSIELRTYNTYGVSSYENSEGFISNFGTFILKEKINVKYLRNFNTSLNLGVGFQFYGKQRPTFRIDLFYRQGLDYFLQTEINTDFNGQLSNSSLKTRGSALGFNISYALRLYSNRPILPRGASDLDIVRRKDENYPSIYIRPTIGNFSFIGRIIDNPSNRYKNINSSGDAIIGGFVDINLSKRWALTTGFFGGNIGTSQKISYRKESEFISEIGFPSFHIPFYARLQTNKLNFNSFFRYLSLETFAGSSIDFVTSPNFSTSNFNFIDDFVTPSVNINQTQNITTKNTVNLSVVTGVGIQFYGKYRPTFKLEIFYRQGLGDMLENKIITSLNNETYQATYRTRGSGVGFNLSYPFKLWEKKKKVNQ